MINERLLSKITVSEHDCSDMHEWNGVRDVYVLHYIVSGSGSLTVRGRVHKLSRGQIFAVYPGEPTAYSPDADDPYFYKWVDFNGSLARPLLDATSLGADNPVTPPLPSLEADFDRLMGDGDLLSPCNPLLLELLAHLIEYCPAPESMSVQQSCALTAYDYILAKLSRPELRVQDVAEHIGVSRSCLYRLFMDRFGLSPMQFIVEERINKAKRLLEAGMSVKNTAASCGYEDALYFSLAFKKRCQVSPAAYRSQHFALGG